MSKKTDEDRGRYATEQEDSIENANEMLGKGYNVRAKDESNDRKYFTITPRIVKAFARSPHDLALWETVKDITGEDGECFLNTNQLATLAGMSAGQVSKSRKYWLKIGFLKGEIRKDEGYTQGVYHLTVPDLWQKNIEWCEKHPKIKDRLEFRMQHLSLHTVKPSPSESKPSPSETKKNLIKKNQEDTYKPDPVFTALEQQQGSLSTDTPRYVDTWREKHTDEWILKAIDIAKEKGVRRGAVNYVDAILIGWEANGYPKTRDEKVKERRNAKNKSTAGQVIQNAADEAARRVGEIIRERRASSV